jgi:hypothetical protein
MRRGTRTRGSPVYLTCASVNAVSYVHDVRAAEIKDSLEVEVEVEVEVETRTRRQS